MASLKIFVEKLILRYHIQRFGDCGHTICSRKAFKYSIVTISISNVRQDNLKLNIRKSRLSI
jgi:hypothetical protein